MGYIGRYTAPSIVDLESPVSVDGTTIIENGVLKNVGIDGIKLKSSGDSITKSDGTTAVLSESSGTVTFAADGLAVNGTSSLDGAVVVNESGADADFRVESDTSTHALFVQGSDGKVGILSNAPTRSLYVAGDSYITGRNFLNSVFAYRISTGTATRNVKLHSSGGETWGKLTLVGLWPYSGSGHGTVTVEFTAFPQEGRVTVIETKKGGGGSTVTVSVTGDDTNDVINFQISSSANGWRFSAFCELLYGSDTAYLTIDGTNG